MYDVLVYDVDDLPPIILSLIVKQYNKTLKAGLFSICKQEQTEYIEVYLWHDNHGMKLLAYNFFCV